MKYLIRSIFLAFIALTIVNNGFAQGATYEVSNLNDAGPGSFRQAIIDANATSERDTISFIISGNLNLTTSINSINNLPNITSEVDIYGNGVVITNSIIGRFIQLDANCTWSDVTFDGGSSIASAGSTAGAIFIKGSVDEVNFDNCIFRNNEANLTGGALRIVGASVTFDNCQFMDNVSGDDIPISCTNGCNTTFRSTVSDIVLEGNTGLLINPPFEIGLAQTWQVVISP